MIYNVLSVIFYYINTGQEENTKIKLLYFFILVSSYNRNYVRNYLYMETSFFLEFKTMQLCTGVDAFQTTR